MNRWLLPLTPLCHPKVWTPGLEVLSAERQGSQELVSGGRLERQEARPKATFWTPGGSSAGRLGRQEARMQVSEIHCSIIAKCRFCAGGSHLAMSASGAL